MAYVVPNGYRDRFSVLNNYQKLLFIEGNGLQASELNELQDSIRNDLSLISNYLVANGTVLSGGTISSLLSTSVSITAAGVLINGHVVQVPANTITITGVGTEIIGVAYITNLVSYINDPTLVELDTQSPIVGQPTSYREQAQGRWCLSSQLLAGEVFFPIITLNNGQVITISPSTSTPYVNALNAYDREVRGSATLYGLGVSYAYPASNGTFVLSISSGKARVLGNPVVVPYTQQISLSALTDLGTVNGEPYSYTGSATYNLNNPPVQGANINGISTPGVVQVQGVKQVTVTNQVHNLSNQYGSDGVTNTPLYAIVSVSQGSTNYVLGTDYKQTGNNVDWSINPGTRPPPPAGSTYTITYQYISTFTAAISSNNLGVVLDSTNILVANSPLYISYQYYLTRIDRLSIDPTGNYVITRGTPGYGTVYAQPYLSNALSLATISLTYGQNPVVTQDTINNVLVANFNILQQQVNNNTLAIATLSLQQNANAQQPASIKRGTVVDNLANTSQQDPGLTTTLILLPDTSNANATSGNSLALASSLSILGTTTAWVYLPYTQIAVQSQTAITGTRQINPYSSQTTTTLQPRIVMNPPIKYGNELWYWFHGNFLPYNTVVQAQCSGFQPGETVNVYIGNSNIFNILPISSGITGNAVNGGTVSIATTDLSYYISSSVTNATGVADSTGSVNIPMTIQAGTVNGVYLTSAVGLTSQQAATTTFSIYVSPDRLSGDYYVPITNPVAFGYDPLAETFQLSTNYDLVGVGLYVGAVPGDDLRVRITDAKYGIPDTTTLLADGLIKKANLKANQWQTVPLTNPATAVGNASYAITALTSTATGSLGTAVMGYYDINTKQLITVQPASGVLQTSANYSTWTPVQNEDLSYVLYAASYSTNTPTTTLLLSTASIATANAITDWFISGTVVTPPGTSCQFYLKNGTNQYPITPNQALYTPPLSGVTQLYCVMNSTKANVSPRIQTGLELLGGTTVGNTTGATPTPGVYYGRGFPVPAQSNGTQSANLFLVADANIPAAATVSVQFASNSGLTTYGTATLVGTPVSINGSWYTYTWQLSANTSTATRLKITMQTTDSTQRPRMQNLRILIV